MTTATLELPDVIGFVSDRAEHDDLDALGRALKARRKALRERDMAKVIKNAPVITFNLRPPHFNGLTGVVKLVDTTGGKKRATVTLDKGSTTRYAQASPGNEYLIGQEFYDLENVPLACLRVIGS
ncbi:MAG TPA: hypothetical protein VFG15_07050 [Amycolatopsis sp.]|nr:hypothetical protein [Amycolatopsis sp.]